VCVCVCVCLSVLLLLLLLLHIVSPVYSVQDHEDLPHHSFKLGMKLEMVSPWEQMKICPVTVSQVSHGSSLRSLLGFERPFILICIILCIIIYILHYVLLLNLKIYNIIYHFKFIYRYMFFIYLYIHIFFNLYMYIIYFN